MTFSDVFGRRLIPSISNNDAVSSEVAQIHSQIKSLRNRLLSLSITARAISTSTGPGIPSLEDATSVQVSLTEINEDASSLPATIDDATVNADLSSFRSELASCHSFVERSLLLGKISNNIIACDNAFSDLLEHADMYPAAPPPGLLASTHISDPRLPSEEQLKNRLEYCNTMVQKLRQACSEVNDDARVTAEQNRIDQTWTELEAMCTDRLNGIRSRPASSVSSAGKNGVDIAQSYIRKQAKPSLSSNGPRPNSKDPTKRTVSGSTRDPLRPPSHLSTRSVSGPGGSSSLYNQTFASRQRTTSLASVQSSNHDNMKRPASPLIMLRKRTTSPTFSEASSRSIVSTPSRSTWARAPRQSFGTVPRNFQTNTTPKRKPYIANPNSKLDVAVGNVVNNFRLPVTVQAATDGWRDQSGRYWIGDIEPRLCFCRILRSQTVMVRVGGGWCELSK